VSWAANLSFNAKGFDVAAGIDVDRARNYSFEQNVGGEFFAIDIQNGSATYQ
jgi:hypothetical protein